MPTFNYVQDILQVTSTTSSILSILGDLFVIMSYLKVKPETMLSTLVFWLAVSDFFGATAIIIGLQVWPYPIACEISGALFFGFFLVSFMWTLFIALHHFNPNQKSMKWRHVVCWGYAFILTAMVMSMRRFGRPYPLETCWFKSNDDLYMWICFFGTLAIIWAFNAFTYVRIIYLRKRNRIFNDMDTEEPVGREAATTEAETKARKLAMYTLVFIVCWAPEVLGNLLQLKNAEKNLSSDFGLVVSFLASFFTPLQGFLNSLVYGLTEDMKEFIRYLLCRRNTTRYHPIN